MKARDELLRINACREALEWAGQMTFKQAWETCHRGDWMLLFAKMQGVDIKLLTLAKVKCAKLVEHLMMDERSINALRIGEKFALGEATRDELNSAYDAAYDAASYATAYAATSATSAAYAGAAYADAAAAAAYAAAYAASAASDAGAAAAAYAAGAKKNILNQCADICRDLISFDLLNLDNK